MAIPAQAGTTVQGTVKVGRAGLSVRLGATTKATRVAILPPGAVVTIACQVAGQSIRGRVRTTNRWNRLVDGRYVSDAFVRRSQSLATCGSAAASATTTGTLTTAALGTPVGSWRAPVPYKAVQGFRTASRPTHDGEDIMAPRGTPIRAAAAGRVVTVTCNASTGNCDVDGSPAVSGCGWYVEILHAGSVVTRSCHLLRKPPVSVGQKVKMGQIVGHVGSSGRSSAPHLHFEVHLGTPATSQNAIDPIAFMRKAKAPIG